MVRREIVMLSKREDVPLCIELRAPDLALHLRGHVLVERVVILAVERSLPGRGVRDGRRRGWRMVRVRGRDGMVRVA